MLLHKILKADGTKFPVKDTPDNWIVTYATALAMDQDPAGAMRALEWVKDSSHPGLTRLRWVLDRWRQTLTVMERLNFRITGKPPLPVTIDFPPGVL